MLKKLLFLLPPVVFLSVIIGVFFIWLVVQNDPPTPPSVTPNNTPAPTSPPPTSTSIPPQPITEQPTSLIVTTPSNTPLPPSATATSTYTPLPPPTAIFTPTPTPLAGIVIAEKLNVRQGPSSNYGWVGGLKKGNQIIILRRTPSANWFEIITPDRKIGWVAAEYIEIPPETNIGLVPTATIGPTPTRPPTPSRPSSDFLLTFDLRGGSVSGRLNADQEQWYIFSVVGPETIIALTFMPNVNFFGDQFQAYRVQFSIYSHNQIPFWYPDEPDVPNLGAGSHGQQDRDGDYGTGELVWRSGNLAVGTSFYLRIVNQSTTTIRYCLSPKDEYGWSCPKN